MKLCLWCGAEIPPPQRKFCNRSHGQMHFANTHPKYQLQQRRDKRARRPFCAKTVNKNLRFIVAAMMIERDNILGT